MFAVALCGLAPQEALDLHEAGVLVGLPAPSDELFLDVAAPVLAELQDAAGAVLVLHAERVAGARRVAAARNLADAKSTAALPLDLPPSALVAVAALLQDLARLGVPAGTVLAHLDLVIGACVVGGRTTSVTRLAVPGVSLGQHLRSWVPGAVFTVAIAPAFDVSPGRRAVPTPPTSVPARVVSAGDAQLADGLLDPAAPTPAAAVHLDDPAPSRTWWAARRVYELAAVPADAAPLADALLARPRGRCRLCGDAVRDTSCTFCSALEVL